MTGYDHPDWQATSLAADNPQSIDSEFNTVLASGISVDTAPVDCGQFTSLAMRILWQASNPFEYLRITVHWLDPGSNQIWQETLCLNPATAVKPAPDEAYLRLPCRGSQVYFTFHNLGSAGVLHQYTYTLWGSFRPVDRLQVVEAWGGATVANTTDGTDGSLITLVDSKVASTDYPMAVHWGEVSAFLANAGGATVNLSMSIVDPISGQAVANTGALGAGISIALTFRLAARAYILRCTAAGAGTIKPVAMIHGSNE